MPDKTRAASQVLLGARYYWRHRVTPYPVIASFIAVGAIAGEITFLAIGHNTWAFGWVAAVLAFVVGDITTLFKYTRCKYCGFVVAPAPSRRMPCPNCKQLHWGNEHAF